MENQTEITVELAQVQIDFRALLDMEIVLIGGGAEVVSFY